MKRRIAPLEAYRTLRTDSLKIVLPFSGETRLCATALEGIPGAELTGLLHLHVAFSKPKVPATRVLLCRDMFWYHDRPTANKVFTGFAIDRDLDTIAGTRKRLTVWVWITPRA